VDAQGSLQPVPERRRTGDAELAAYADALPHVLARVDRKGRLVYANQCWAELTGQSLDDALGLGYLRAVHPGDVAILTEAATVALQAGRRFVERIRVVRPGGEPRWVKVRGAPYLDRHGRLAGAVASVIDVTEDMEVQRQRDRLAAVLSTSPDATMISRRSGETIYSNPAADSMFGEGVPFAHALTPTCVDTYLLEALPAVDQFGIWSGELAYTVGADLNVPILVVISGTRDDHGEVVELVHSARDVAELKWQQDQLAHLATHDGLTGLPNRMLLVDRLAHAVQRCAREADPMAVLFVDLDWFKAVNDEFGHDGGDEVLRVAARRIEDAVRGGDTVARFGGDEFVVVCERVPSLDVAAEIGQRIVQALEPPIPVAGGVARVGASVGIAMYDATMTAEELLQAADAAMYEAKRAGRSRIVSRGG
jgi:diguanylate cyclase (GGDEF)-like protein/PAS domain S-box-containing protein